MGSECHAPYFGYSVARDPFTTDKESDRNEYDESDPKSWFGISPGSNVLNGRYPSAKPFVEKLQHQEIALLERMVEEREARRKAIQREILRETDFAKAEGSLAVQCSSSAQESLSKISASAASDETTLKEERNPICGDEVAFAKDFMAKLVSVPNLLKRTIKEKIMITSKKFAKPNDIAQVVRFFNNLLTGLTVYGFDDKMINLKDDDVAINWAMALIIDTYVVILLLRALLNFF
ncbi:unnamed protein product [Gongylonema pulchrum]|uniref:Uncharacterized protein n=1 Tax=Gongylonema pulchrum TaxID=637853 RepID=A0A183E0J2_9BILA|nr:unnamed protein product [Gongylonema pulchrum]